MRSGRFVLVVTALAALTLIVAACGGGAGSDDPASLPTNPNPDDTPAAVGACVEGEPDCVDTVVIGDEEPLPSGSDDEGVIGSGGGVAGSGMLVDGGLTVSEALTTDATGTIAVRGFLVDDGTEARLCEVLAESYPPQCAGAFLPVAGYEEVVDVPLSNAEGVTWTDDHVSLLGEIVGGILVVDPTAAG